MLALGLLGGRVMLVDEATLEVRWTVQAHAERANEHGKSEVGAHVAMSPNGRFVASVGGFTSDRHSRLVGGDEENWKLWDSANGAAWMTGARHDGTGACICADALEHVFDLDHPVFQEGWEGCPVVAHTCGLSTISFSPCGQRFASGDKEGTVILWDAHTGEAEHRMQGGVGSVWSLAFSADGARLACGNEEGSICVWDVAGELLRTLEPPDEPKGPEDIDGLQFSPVNASMLARTGGGTITLLDVDSGEVIRSFKGFDFVAFAPDGQTIATCASNFYDILLVNTETGTVRLTLPGYQRGAFAAAFSVEGSKLASMASCITPCTVWDTSTGKPKSHMVGAEKGMWTSSYGEWFAGMLPAEIVSISSGRDWSISQNREAFAMGHHLRLGERSEVLALDEGVVRMILDRV